jgi:ribose 5-phosphate isomerase B
MRIAIAGDHNGVAVKRRLVSWLEQRGHRVEDRGVQDGDDPVDYPPLCADLCAQVVDGAADLGVVVGGAGSGEAIACNKVRGIRAALCSDTFTAEISRAHNGANVLVLGAKVVAPELAERILAVWLDTPFSGGVHQQRIEQITALERGERLTAD